MTGTQLAQWLTGVLASIRWCFLSLLLLVGAQPVAAGVFYKLEVVAESGAGFSGFGTGPAINGNGVVAYVTKSSLGDSIEMWESATGARDLAPGFRSPGRSFGEGVSINDHDEVVTWNRVLGANPRYELRVFRRIPDASIIAEHASPTLPISDTFDLLFQYPAINNSLVLEDRARSGNRDGRCDPGEECFSQVAFGGFRAPNRWISRVIQNPISAISPIDNGIMARFGLNTSVSRPVITDDARVLVRGNLPTNPILLFNSNLTASTQVAGASDGFTVLGVAPGITPQGNIIAFAGNRGLGDGVFLSIEYAPGKRRLVRIVGENSIVTKPELGYNDLGNHVYFSSIELDSRIGVINGPGRNGSIGIGSVVVSFIGTPSGIGRSNPGAARPFAFSAEKGLWTIHVDLTAHPFITDDVTREQICVALISDFVPVLPPVQGDDVRVAPTGSAPYIAAGPNRVCETPNDHQSATLFSGTSPLPVVQIGDVIRSGSGLHTITAISVNGPLAQANIADGPLSLPRTPRIGDHRVAFWAQAGAKQLIVRGSHLDSDQDGLLDHWETEGIELTPGGGVDLDLPAMGANPRKRDLFVQMDWVVDRDAKHRHDLQPGVIKSLADFYASAPALPNGIPAGITLHVDAGSGSDVAGLPYSYNMGTAVLRGGKTIRATGGAPLDVLYFGVPGSIRPGDATAADFETIKRENFWNAERGAREFAFSHVVFADLNGRGFSPSSTVTSATATVVRDATADWSLVKEGMGLLITSGPAKGQLRRIIRGGSFLEIDPTDPFDPIPPAGSGFRVIETDLGIADVLLRYDGTFAPSKNVIIAFGAAEASSLSIDGALFKFLGSGYLKWRVVAHELGHTLTLKHGGSNHRNDKPRYGSLMNYAYTECQTGMVAKTRDGVVLPGSVPCPVGYSPISDDIFWDWGNLDFKSSFNLGAVGTARGLDASYTPPFPPEREDFDKRHGPRDQSGPVVTLTAPAPGASVTRGSTLPASFTVTDDIGVARTEVAFDVNGNGAIDPDTEVFAATVAAGGRWSVTIPAISGPDGTRKLTALAYDRSDNPGARSVNIRVGAVSLVVVPNVVNKTQSAATADLVAVGLVLGTVTTASSATIAAGNVISQAPAAGTSVAVASLVNLVVSTGPAPVVVPNVVGQAQATATANLVAAGLKLGTVTTTSSPTVPAGNVISQTPTAGTTVAAGSAVNLVVSSGPAPVSVPNVVGQTQTTASANIVTAGLKVGTVTSMSSSTVPAGNVISQTPVAGTSVAAGSAVNLVVSSGPAAVIVPNVVGQALGTASPAIAAAGLNVGTVTTAASATVAVGNVISQTPAAGTSVAAGSSVNLVISSGPAPVPVPNVVGQTQTTATANITAAGLKVGTVTTQASSTVAAGRVISTTPAAGASAAPGSTVNLVVSSGPLPGDVNGDNSLTCADVTIVKAAFGKRSGQPGFDARADVVKDNVIDIRDLAFVSQRLPAGTKCS